MDAEVGYERTAAEDWTRRAQDLYQSGQLCMAPFNTGGVIVPELSAGLIGAVGALAR